MPVYAGPVREFNFLLSEVLKLDRFANLPRFSEAPPELVSQILEEGAKFCEGVLQPLNVVGDKAGCTRHPDGSVSPPPGFKEAYSQYVEAGWPSLACDQRYGGQGLPNVINMALSEMVSAANMSFGLYPGLAHGCYSALLHHGTDELKDRYLPKIVSGEWTGTMNLTEPHCGTDLGLLRTKAVPVGDGSYKISGQKIFISAGDHDMAENIVHLVLARTEGAPAGVRGISLFVVPKFIPDANGNPGKKNAVSCGKLEEKMGIHGSATCVLDYDEAIGWMVAEENKGLSAMFTMMNEARLLVGVQGLSQGEVAFQNGRKYANERLQGRSLSGPKNAAGPADPIIVHPDVRRMLMTAKAFTEGGRAFALWAAMHGDLAEVAQDEAQKTRAADYMALLTPVIKSYLTEKGYETAVDCQQIFGGHGYIEEHGMSQFVRDARITMIYEGANGVQALDLVGRKLAANGGRAISTYFAEIDEYVKAKSGDAAMKPYLDGLAASKGQLQEATMWLMQNAMSNFDNAGAASHDYLNLFGLTALSYMWAQMAEAALAAKAGGASDPFYDTKLATADYFVQRMLPDAGAHLAKLKTGAASLMALPAEAF